METCGAGDGCDFNQLQRNLGEHHDLLRDLGELPIMADGAGKTQLCQRGLTGCISSTI